MQENLKHYGVRYMLFSTDCCEHVAVSICAITVATGTVLL